MKKIIILTFLLIVLIIPLISAVDFEMKTEFDQGETLLAKVSGNFLEPVTKDNIFFYRGHVRVPTVYDVIEVDDEFYIYALLTGKIAGNYSIALENIRYMQVTEVSQNDITKDFIITENTTDFLVNPGFLECFLCDSDDFYLEVLNLQVSRITIQITTSENLASEDSVEVRSGETKEIDFELVSENPFSEIIELVSENTNYSVPVFIFSNQTIERKDRDFGFEPKIVDVSMATDSEAKIIIYLINTGEEDIEDITFSISPILEPYIVISPETINTLDKDSQEKIEIDVISDLDEAILEGKISAQAENISTNLTLILDFVQDYIPAEGEVEGEEVIMTTCEQLEGAICEENEECSEEVIYAKDGVCCTGTCEEVKKGLSGKLIGWTIVVAIILFLFWFFKKRYKRAGQRKPNLLKIAKGKKK